MPVIRIKKTRLHSLVEGVSEDELKEALFNLKAEVEEDEILLHRSQPGQA